jgi:hypothetical protein
MREGLVEGIIDIRKALVAPTEELRKMVCDTSFGTIFKHKDDKNYHQFSETEKSMLESYCLAILTGGILAKKGKPQTWVYDNDNNIMVQFVNYNPSNIVKSGRAKHNAMMVKIESFEIVYSQKEYSGLPQKHKNNFSVLVTPKLK